MGTATDSLQDTREFRRKGIVATALYLVAVLAMGGAMWGLVWHQGAQRPVVRPEDSVAAGAGKQPVIAGTGAALPLLRHLARAYRGGGGEVISIPPSIGSSGGMAALQDGVIDCAVVSRYLSEKELDGRVAISLASAPVVLAAGLATSLEGISRSDLLALVRHATTGEAGGTEMVLREPGDSAQEALAQRIPGLAEAYQEATAARAWPIAFTDADMERLLLGRDDLVGAFDLGTINLRRLPLRPVPIDGLTEEVLRPFILVCRKDHRVSGFLEFLSSNTAREIISQAGYTLAGEAN